MKQYTEKTVTQTVKVMTCRTCDLCGVESKYHSDNWHGGWYQVNETEIKVIVRMREGVNYPEGGNGTETEIDLCPACFKGKLIPWLQSQGATINPEEYDW